MWNQITVAVKDNISSAAFSTTCASAALAEHVSPYNAKVLDVVEQFGATVVGKTNMDQFGMGSHSSHSRFGPVFQVGRRNKLSPGGSSGGSAVVVAAGRSIMALGTDTGGSVRLPAAYTETTGIKPSYGTISRWGVVPYANSLDTVGFFFNKDFSPEKVKRARELFDFDWSAIDWSGKNADPTLLSKSCRKRLVASVIRYAHSLPGVPEYRAELEAEGKSLSIPPRMRGPLRIGVPMEYNTKELSPEVRSTWQKLLEVLQEQGHQIVPISLPTTKYALSAYYIIAAAEAASNLAKYDGIRYGERVYPDGLGGVLFSKTRGNGFGAEVQRRILLGNYTLSSKAIESHFIQAQKIRRLVQQDFDRVFALPNGLREQKPIDLSELDESIPLEDKKGPSQVDIIICPTAPTTAPRRGEVGRTPTEVYMNDVFTVPASLAGLPAVNLPVEFTSNVHPIGMQLIGQYFDDHFVVELAAHIHFALQTQDFNVLKPPIRRHKYYYRSVVR